MIQKSRKSANPRFHRTLKRPDGANKPKNGNGFAWKMIQLSAVVWHAGANEVFFHSPAG
jgi:hypothetical protein